MEPSLSRLRSSHAVRRPLKPRLARRRLGPVLALLFCSTWLTVLPAAPAQAATNQTPVTGQLASVTSAVVPLTPAFQPGIHDYALWCPAPTNTITLSLGAAAGGTITVGGQTGSSLPFTVTLASDDALVLQTAAGDYWLRCLPPDFPPITATEISPVSPGWYLTDTTTGSPYTMILDTHGTPVWYARAPQGALNTQVISGQLLSWSPFLGPVGMVPGGAFQLYDLTTNVTTTWGPSAGLLDMHELIKLRSGNWAWFNTPIRRDVDLSGVPQAAGTAGISDCVIEEIDTSGQPIWSWRMSEHVSPKESLVTPYVGNSTGIGGELFYDAFHCNSMEEEPGTGNLLISARNLSALLLVERSTGRILWKMGGTPSASGARSIQVIDPAGAFSAQHDARFLPNGNISIFDNSTLQVNKAARGVSYAMDYAAGTATRNWSYSAPEGSYAPYTGSFRRFDASSYVIGWGGMSPFGFSEVSAAGQLQLRVKMPQTVTYRVVKVPAATFSVAALRAAAGKRSLTPPTMLDVCTNAITVKSAAQSEAGTAAGSVAQIGTTGCRQPFTAGAIVWSAATAAWWVPTDVLSAWDAQNAQAGSWGFPTSDAASLTGGVVQRFEGGLVASSASGVFLVGAPLAQAWARDAVATVGYPVAGPSCPQPQGPCQQSFEHGLMVWSASTGVHVIEDGPIATAYLNAGGAGGSLGLPTTARVCQPDGACWMLFENGVITSLPTGQTTVAPLASAASLAAGATAYSVDGTVRLSMTPEGDLVLRAATGAVLWHSSTGVPGSTLALQSDGNLVINTPAGIPVWASMTTGLGNSLALQNDGNLVVYSKTRVPLWDALGYVGGAGRWFGRPITGLASRGVEAAFNGNVTLTMTAAGDLRLTQRGGIPIWSSGTAIAGSRLAVQSDGNVVIYAPTGEPVWTTMTYSPGAVLRLQDDGNLVLYTASMTPIWDSAGYVTNGSTLLPQPVTTLTAGATATSSTGSPILTMTSAGDLTLFRADGSLVWRSGTSVAGASLTMQPDGNLVLYAVDGSPVWATMTAVPGSRLQLQVDDNLVIYAPNGMAVWDALGYVRNTGVTFQ